MFLYKVVHKVVTRLFTRLLQGCYKVVYKVVTRLLQGCYKVVTRLLPCQLHTCNQVVTRLLHNLVATLLQGCYNLVFSVWAQRVRDLLGYSSTIVKAAHDYEGTLWLSYDAHFRTLAATMQRQDWSYVDQSLWSQHFNRAAVRQEGGNPLSVGPYGHNTSSEPVGKTSSGKSAKGKERLQPYTSQPICIRWNKELCVSPTCTYRHVFVVPQAASANHVPVGQEGRGPEPPTLSERRPQAPRCLGNRQN